MRHWIPSLLLALALLAGCAKGLPKAATPETEYDFGDVPVTADMSQAELKEFVIKNEGTANLQLGQVQIKTIEGC